MTLSANQGIKTFCFMGQCQPGRDWQTSVSCKETEMAIGRMRIFRMVCENCCGKWLAMIVKRASDQHVYIEI